MFFYAIKTNICTLSHINGFMVFYGCQTFWHVIVSEDYSEEGNFVCIFLKKKLRYREVKDLHRSTKTKVKVLAWSLTSRKTVFLLFIFFTSTVTFKGKFNNKSNKGWTHSNWGRESTNQKLSKEGPLILSKILGAFIVFFLFS